MLHATMHLCQVQQKLHAALIATVNRQLADAPRGQQQGTGSNTHCQVTLATRLSAPLRSALLRLSGPLLLRVVAASQSS